MADQALQVTTAVPSREDGIELARSTVAGRLAAAAQIVGPVTAAYWHNGEFGIGDEWQVIFQTDGHRYPQLAEHILATHPWSNPQLIAVPIVAAPPAYLSWVRQSMADWS